MPLLTTPFNPAQVLWHWVLPAGSQRGLHPRASGFAGPSSYWLVQNLPFFKIRQAICTHVKLPQVPHKTLGIRKGSKNQEVKNGVRVSNTGSLRQQVYPLPLGVEVHPCPAGDPGSRPHVTSHTAASPHCQFSCTWLMASLINFVLIIYWRVCNDTGWS